MKVRIAKLFNVSLDYLLGAINEQIPLTREDRADFPKGFPKEKIPQVQEYIRTVFLAHKAENKK